MRLTRYIFSRMARTCRPRVVLTLFIVTLLYIFYYFVFTTPYPGTRYVILEDGRRADLKTEQLLNEQLLAKPLEKYDETTLTGLIDCQREDYEVEWNYLKDILLVDPELNLVYLNGQSCGYLPIVAAKFGRHVLVIEEVEKNVQQLIRTRDVNHVTKRMQISHFDTNLEDILSSSLVSRGVLALHGPYTPEMRPVLATIIEKKDIFLIMVVDNTKNCHEMNSFAKDEHFYPVNKNLRPLQEPCRTSGLWVRNTGMESETPPKIPIVNIVNPIKVPSLLNYINCIPVSMAAYNQICYSTLDIFIGPALEGGTWDGFIWHPMRAILAKDPTIGLIDIGANIGAFTISAAAMGRQVLAVEAFYENVQRLCESIRINSMANLVTVVYNAASDTNDDILYFRSPRNNPGGTVVVNNPAFRNSYVAYHGKHNSVRAVRLDELVDLSPRKAVVKIDIEGAELQALRTFDAMLAKIDVVAIFMEWTSVPRTHECMYIVEMLKKHGYRARGLHYRGWWLKGVQIPLYGETWQEVKQWPSDIVWLRDA